MKHSDLFPLCDLIKKEYIKSFLDDREIERQEAKQHILWPNKSKKTHSFVEGCPLPITKLLI